MSFASLMMAPEKTQSALIVQAKDRAQLRHDLAIPSPNPNQILIRTRAVALNPSDWMALELFSRAGAGMGFDFAGTVVELGSGTHQLWAIGERVAGMVHGYHSADYVQGAFREYILTDADLVMRIPAHISFAEASAIGMGISTAGQALYQSLMLSLPEVEPKPVDETILIYGGSTSTGSLAIQLAKLSGYRVITTCSARNKEWLRSLQADEVIDYTDEDAVTSVLDSIGAAGLTSILDCIANPDTAAFCYQCLTPSERPTPTSEPTFTYASLMPVGSLPPKPESLPADSVIIHRMNMVYTSFGRRFNLLDRTWEPSSMDREFMVRFYRRVENLLSHGKLRSMPFTTMQGGLAGISRGIAEVRDGRVRGKKLVYVVTE